MDDRNDIRMVDTYDAMDINDNTNNDDDDEGMGGDATGEQEKDAQRIVETDRLLNHSLIPDSVKNGIMGERSRRTGTGVKGVLADYKQEQALKAAERTAVAAEREAVLHRIAYGAKRPAGEVSYVKLF